ncbi:hypothetical protein RND71_041277 [Anisodus tanguticus]|uniref:Uncharacterized protein n=1 Tax=Anisodus tanguticus TaxID=243964 RepID=A0AAE1QUA5_9SOLA|nr:hypothetical protein RND71_041277 [Anisodus tanguticus]
MQREGDSQFQLNQEDHEDQAEELEQGNFSMTIGESSTTRNSFEGELSPLENSDNQLVNYSDIIPLSIDEGMTELFRQRSTKFQSIFFQICSFSGIVKLF